jgi:hypothetical protein
MLHQIPHDKNLLDCYAFQYHVGRLFQITISDILRAGSELFHPWLRHDSVAMQLDAPRSR